MNYAMKRLVNEKEPVYPMNKLLHLVRNINENVGFAVVKSLLTGKKICSDHDLKHNPLECKWDARCDALCALINEPSTRSIIDDRTGLPFMKKIETKMKGRIKKGKCSRKKIHREKTTMYRR
jgi:hypothetical protein